MRLLLPLLFCAFVSAPAVESPPVAILRVLDGDTVDVHPIGDADPTKVVRVRLLYVDTDETHNNEHGRATPEGFTAKAYLSKILPPEAQVTLYAPGEKFSFDRNARCLAVLNFNMRDPQNPTESIATSAEELLIYRGHSVYWVKYGPAPEPLNARLLALEIKARESRAGGWGTEPKAMEAKWSEGWAAPAHAP